LEREGLEGEGWQTMKREGLKGLFFVFPSILLKKTLRFTVPPAVALSMSQKRWARTAHC
jgi:hypothetical protein